jgi:alpha-aminoadipic semialdehyde synthase
VAFGRYAGIAGAFDFFRGVGEFFLSRPEHLQSPFIFLGSSYMYEDYDAMKAALASVGRGVSRGLPKQVSPLVFGVTGTGRVSQGILEVLEQLPHIRVKPDELKDLLACSTDNKRIVITQFSAEHLVRHKEGKPFNKQHYYEHPDEYESKFCQDYLEHVHFLINGIYWDKKFPRVISIDELRDAKLAGKSKLLGVCDISADANGSIEFTSRFTSIEHPFLLYDAITEEFSEKMDKVGENSVLFHSVDHLPAEMPKEASNHFGSQLMQFVKKVAESDASLPVDGMVDLPPEISNAIICAHGQLTKKY